jgi:hypothetical protein
LWLRVKQRDNPSAKNKTVPARNNTYLGHFEMDFITSVVAGVVEVPCLGHEITEVESVGLPVLIVSDDWASGTDLIRTGRRFALAAFSLPAEFLRLFLLAGTFLLSL